MSKTVKKTQAPKSKSKGKSKKESQEFTDVTSSRHIKDSTRWALIAAAGGQCEFRGCYRFPFEHHVTKEPGNFSQAAHIIAFKPSGPRGLKDARLEDIHAFENLMLLCADCHHRIDTESSKHTSVELREWKRLHEERIRWLLNLTEESECAILEVWTDLSNTPVVKSREKVIQAIHPLYPSEHYWKEIDLTGNNLSDRTLVQAAIETIDDRLNQIFSSTSGRPSKLAVFGITHMPLLAYLGSKIGDRIDVQLFQFHRDTKDWIWKEEEPKVTYETKKLQDGNDPAKVALILSLSDPVIPDAGLKESDVPVDSSYTVYEMRLTSDDPNRDFLRTEEDLEKFRQAYSMFYSEFAKKHNTLETLRIFPAVPIPIALSLGMCRLPKIHPKLDMWDKDQQNGGWRHVLDVD